MLWGTPGSAAEIAGVHRLPKRRIVRTLAALLLASTELPVGDDFSAWFVETVKFPAPGTGSVDSLPDCPTVNLGVGVPLLKLKEGGDGDSTRTQMFTRVERHLFLSGEWG